MYNLCKSSADLEQTPCLGQQDELINSFYVIVYLYDVILYINTLYSNSDIVGVFIVNRCTLVYH